MIPWLLIAVGGVMIYAGVKGDSPIEVIKSVLTSGTTPTQGTTSSSTTPTPYVPGGNVSTAPGAFGDVIRNNMGGH